MKARFKPKYNIRKGDSVVVITGDDKDLSKPRIVKEVLVEDAKVLVEGVNIITKHTKPSAQNTKGGIVKKEAPIHISNVMLWDREHFGQEKFQQTVPSQHRHRDPGAVSREADPVVRNPLDQTGLVELLDLFPTFCDFAELPAPETLDGKSFLPLLHDFKAEGNWDVIADDFGDLATKLGCAS